MREFVNTGRIEDEDGVLKLTHLKKGNGQELKDPGDQELDCSDYKWPCIVQDITAGTVVISIGNPTELGFRAYALYEITNDVCRQVEKLPNWRIYWPPQFRGPCSECFGTGLTGGFQAPCSRGCA